MFLLLVKSGLNSLDRVIFSPATVTQSLIELGANRDYSDFGVYIDPSVESLLVVEMLPVHNGYKCVQITLKVLQIARQVVVVSRA